MIDINTLAAGPVMDRLIVVILGGEYRNEHGPEYWFTETRPSGEYSDFINADQFNPSTDAKDAIKVADWVVSQQHNINISTNSGDFPRDVCRFAIGYALGIDKLTMEDVEGAYRKDGVSRVIRTA